MSNLILNTYTLLKDVESQLKNFIVYDSETHITDRGRIYVFCLYRLSKLAGRYNRGSTEYERGKCKRDSLVFQGDDCVSNALDFWLKLKGEGRKDKKNSRRQSSTTR